MSPKQPSKQKRAAQNRNERAARAARATNANAPQQMSKSTTTASSSGGGSLLSRLRGGGSRQPAASAVGSARARGAAMRPGQPVGYRAALSAVLAAAAALVLCVVALRYPVDARGDVYTRETLTADWSMTALRSVAEHPDESAEEVAATIKEWAPGRSRDTVAKALWPFSLALVLPLIGSGLGFHAVRKRSTSKVVNRALYATLFGAVLTQGLLLLFLPVVLAMGVAMFQVRKAETIAASRGTPGVIDVDGDEVVDVVESE
ncbi:MAG: hypothetical protein WD691_06040 [Acidimicrobiales bacterium]